MNGMAESHNNILKKRMLYDVKLLTGTKNYLYSFVRDCLRRIKNHTPSERVETRKGWTPHEPFTTVDIDPLPMPVRR